MALGKFRGRKNRTHLIDVPQQPRILVQHLLLEIRDEGIRRAQERVFRHGGIARRGGGGVVLEGGGHCGLDWIWLVGIWIWGGKRLTLSILLEDGVELGRSWFGGLRSG